MAWVSNETTCSVSKWQECVHLHDTWNMTAGARGEETQSVRMKIDTVRCVGPSSAPPLRKDRCLFSISAPARGFFFFFLISPSSIFYSSLMEELSNWQKVWKKLLYINAEDKRQPIKAPCLQPSVDAKVRNLLPAGCWSTSPQHFLQPPLNAAPSHLRFN